MRDKAHIGLIYAHTESNGRDDNHALFAQKARLIGRPIHIAHARMVRQGRAPLAPQPLGCGVHLFARQTVNNAGVLGMSVVDKTP